MLPSIRHWLLPLVSSRLLLLSNQQLLPSQLPLSLQLPLLLPLLLVPANL